jgi:hypothetical protein
LRLAVVGWKVRTLAQQPQLPQFPVAVQVRVRVSPAVVIGGKVTVMGQGWREWNGKSVHVS